MRIGNHEHKIIKHLKINESLLLITDIYLIKMIKIMKATNGKNLKVIKEVEKHKRLTGLIY